MVSYLGKRSLCIDKDVLSETCHTNVFIHGLGQFRHSHTLLYLHLLFLLLLLFHWFGIKLLAFASRWFTLGPW